MTDIDEELVSKLKEDRARFLSLIADIRPDLHRYAARMTGSVVDGEDIVQETLARAYYSLPDVHTLPALRSWLFQIAHNRALDFLRRYDRKMGQPLEVVEAVATEDAPDAEDELARREAVHEALCSFSELPPAQRSSVILKDVLGHSIEEIAALLDLSIPATKALVHRGRARLRATVETKAPERTAPHPRKPSPAVLRYAELFNARDWDGVRALLAEDVRLDLVSKSLRSGRGQVSGYVANYAAFDDWYLVPAWLEGREVVASFRDRSDARPGYFVEVSFAEGKVSFIRDFRYVPYICVDAAIELTGARALPPTIPRVDNPEKASS